MKLYHLNNWFLVLSLFLTTLNLYPQTFSERSYIFPGVSKGSPEFGDYDNDGDLDLLVSGVLSDNSVTVKLFQYDDVLDSFSDPGNIFTPVIPYLEAGYSSKVETAWVDFDNDGFIDIIILQPNTIGGYQLMIYSNNDGNSTFTLEYITDFSTTQGGSSFDCGDYDNDGDKDILLVSSIGTRIFKNEGSFVFSKQESISLNGFTYGSANWADYDNDGDLDILLTGQINWSTTNLYQNQGYNTFVLKTGISLYGGGISEWGDYNNDGLLDLLLGTSINKNNGDNTFTFQLDLPSITSGATKWGDLDNDGDLDIIISGIHQSEKISKIYFNNGNNSFTEATGISLDGVEESSVDLGDYDGDGDVDIVLSGKMGLSKICKIYRNESAVTNPSPQAPSGLASVSTGNDIILTWNPVINDNTPSASMSYNLKVGTTPGAGDIVSSSSSASGYYRISGMGNSQLGTTFVLKNLQKDSYYWSVQAVDNSFRGGSFSSESVFNYSASVQSYGLNVIKYGGTESTLEWSRGNGENCVVFMKEGSTGTALPEDGTTYAASEVFKSGSQISASGWFCIYKGIENRIRVTGLKANNNYIFQVFEFDGGTGTEDYYEQTSVNNPFTFKTSFFTELVDVILEPITSQSFMSSAKSSSFWIDTDNDGDLDLILISTSKAYFYRNDGKDIFNKYIFTSLPLPFSTGYSASFGDYDNDEFIDILVGDNATLYKNNKDNSFSNQTALISSITSAAVSGGDYDNDGDLDIVVAGESYSGGGKVTKIFRNDDINTFTEQTLISLEQLGYGSTQWGDYDNDGYLDLALSGNANSVDDVTRIYRNDRKNNFSELSDVLLESSTFGKLDWGDFDNDGDLDLLVSGFVQTKVYRNDGNNLFPAQDGISLPATGYGSASWGDYDNDGDLDILLTGFDTGYRPVTQLHRNNGDYTFTEDPDSRLPNAGFSSASFGDFDNDGDLDIIITGTSEKGAFSKILRNDFATPNIVPEVPSDPKSIVDINEIKLTWNHSGSDNTPSRAMSYNIRIGTTSGGTDIVSPHSDPSTGARRIVAPGNCNLDSTYIIRDLPFGTYYWSVQAVDNSFSGGPFSAEKTFDVVPVQANNLSAKIISDNSLLLKWERGNGDRCIVFCKQTPSGFALPINNNSYIPDSEFGYGGEIGSTGWYCLYNGRADSVKVTGLAYQKEYSFHVIEYLGKQGNEDYFTDLVDGNPGVFTTSLFAEQKGIALPGSGFNPPAWGDYDNDGLSDILIAGSKIYRNNGDNTFTDSGISLSGAVYGSSAWGDYDNDGDLDIIISGAANASYPPSDPVTKLYRNDGLNIFSEVSHSFDHVYYSSVDWGDYDNDGYIDLLLTGATGNNPHFNPVSKIYRNNGDGTFAEQTDIQLTGVFMSAAKWGDYDNDGDLDIVLTGGLDYDYSSNNVSKIYRNDGNNVFTERPQWDFLGMPDATISWGDYDNDGDLDLAMSTYSVLRVYENSGSDKFSVNFHTQFGYQGASSLAWGDYDNDGYVDLILTRPGLDTRIYRNTGGENNNWFKRQDDEALSSTGCRYVSWADYDNDGDLDFILGYYSSAIIFKNNLVMKSGQFNTNSVPASPSGIETVYSPTGIMLQWDALRNDETPFKTMTYNVSIGTKTDLANICPPHSDTTGYRKIVAMGNAQTDTTFLLKNLELGTYYWRVQAVDQSYAGGAWSAVDSFEVKNVQVFFLSDEVCLDYPTHFMDQSVSATDIASWRWDFNDGNSSTFQNPVHTYSASGTFNVKLVVTDTNGAKDSLTQAVFVRAKPVSDFTAPAVCQGTATTITNTTESNGLAISSWYWDFGNGQTSILQQPPAHGYLGAADYIVELKAYASNGCRDSITKTVTVANYPISVITSSASFTFCKGDSVVLSVGYNDNYSYQWMRDGTGITDADSSRFTVRLSGQYAVSVTNLTGNCLTTSSESAVVVKDMPVKPVIKSDNNKAGKCFGDIKIRLQADQPVTEYSYQWYRNGVPLSNSNKSYLEEFLMAGDYTLRADLEICNALSDVFNITYLESPEKPQINSRGPTVWYLFCDSKNAPPYRWYYNGTLIPDATEKMYIASQKLGNYNVSVSNEKGCYSMSDTISIPHGITSIEDTNPFEGVGIYPNPTSGLFTIEMENNIFGELSIDIFNQNGSKALNIKFEKTTEHFSSEIDLSGQSKGMYLINLSIDKFKAVKKVLVE